MLAPQSPPRVTQSSSFHPQAALRPLLSGTWFQRSMTRTRVMLPSIASSLISVVSTGTSRSRGDTWAWVLPRRGIPVSTGSRSRIHSCSPMSA
jgi:hypothetical protein